MILGQELALLLDSDPDAYARYVESLVLMEADAERTKVLLTLAGADERRRLEAGGGAPRPR